MGGTAPRGRHPGAAEVYLGRAAHPELRQGFKDKPLSIPRFERHLVHQAAGLLLLAQWPEPTARSFNLPLTRNLLFHNILSEKLGDYSVE
jgi:hypothetical protein